MLGRTLPGINTCGLWDALSHNEQAPTYALLTDIGNDIGYGFDAATIEHWIDHCATRLGQMNARMVITDLPTHAVRELPEWRFQIVHRLLFPSQQLKLNDVLATVDAVSGQLRELASKYDASFIEVHKSWYGIDGIHIRRHLRQHAFATMLDSWSDQTNVTDQHLLLTERWSMRWLKPADRTLFGIHQLTAQPAMTLGDGSTLSLY